MDDICRSCPIPDPFLRRCAECNRYRVAFERLE